MLCPSCRRQLSKGATYCGSCGNPLAGGDAPLELVLADATRVPVLETVTIGRAPGNTLQIQDPTVSRTHARVSAGNGHQATIEDTGSSHGTFVDGKRIRDPIPLRDGAEIRIGDAELHVERRRSQQEEGRTIVVKPGATLMLQAGKTDMTAQATQFGMKPKLRSGYALKRLDESEGELRWVLRDLKSNKFRRMDDTDAALFELLDGTRSLVDLIGEAERRLGPGGSARLARLLSDLGERGFLSGIGQTEGGEEGGGRKGFMGFVMKLIGPREKTWSGIGPWFDRLYRRGGWILFTRPVLATLCAIMALGFVAFLVLMIGRYGTPFVVASKLGIGGLIFLLGRFAFVAVHEVAHGLTMSSYGRKVGKAGLKFIFVIPFVYVDTAEAWFETRKRRMFVSSAGPVSDLSLGGLFSILCLTLPESTIRDIFFNLAFAAYIGAIFNLNPFLDRDGYHIMVDVLREPQLRRRAKEQLNARLSGKGRSSDESPVLMRYGFASIGWLLAMAGGAIFITLHFYPVMTQFAPETVIKVVLGTLYVAVFIPVFFVVGKPLLSRFKRAEAEPEPA